MGVDKNLVRSLKGRVRKESQREDRLEAYRNAGECKRVIIVITGHTGVRNLKGEISLGRVKSSDVGNVRRHQQGWKQRQNRTLPERRDEGLKGGRSRRTYAVEVVN